MSGAALVLLGHGSRDAQGAAEFLAIAEGVRAAVPELPVETGVLEFAGAVAPSIAEAFARCVARGARRILAVPVLLHFGGHATADMPMQVAAARLRYPDVDVRLAQPLSGHHRLLDLVAERCAAAEAELDGSDLSPPFPPLPHRGKGGYPGVAAPSDGGTRRGGGLPAPATTVLLVGRGSTSSRANADLFATAGLFQQRSGYRSVEVCFVSLAPPCVPAGLRRCVELGARRILVVPYFVNTGVLVCRIARQVAAASLFHPSVQIALGAHFGPAPQVIHALLDRMGEAWAEVLPGSLAVVGSRR